MNYKSQSLFGIPVAAVTADEALTLCRSAITDPTGSPYTVFSVNTEAVRLACEDLNFRCTLSEADLRLADGEGVVWASGILCPEPLPEKIAGVELGEKLAATQGVSLYILGGRPGVARLAALALMKKYPELDVCGTHNGYFDDPGAIIDDINRCRPDMLFVCMGMPRQEYFITEYKSRLNVRLICALGGSVDIYAGTVKRAPEVFVDHKLEWLYRAICEPSRFRRVARLPGFIIDTCGCAAVKKLRRAFHSR